MPYVTWKMQGYHGPYAYLRESVRVGGKVRARHICYLGRLGCDHGSHGPGGPDSSAQSGDSPEDGLVCSLR